MTVSLKGFFVYVPCAVPQDLVRASYKQFTPQEAVGFLKGAKDRLISQLLAGTEFPVARGVLKERFSKPVFCVAGSAASRLTIGLQIKPLVGLDLELTAGKIADIIDRKIADIAKIIAESRRDVQSEKIQDWLFCQLVSAFRSLAMSSENVLIFQQIGITIPEELTNMECRILVETMREAFESQDLAVKKAKEIIKIYFYAALGQNMPEAMLEGIQNIYHVSGAVEAMRHFSRWIPSPITRQNVGHLMCEIDDWCDEECEEAMRLENIVTPYFDSLFESTL